jgi:hypothetical protein
MYFPYLRAKEFELKALLDLPLSTFQKVLPILEPVNLKKPKMYGKLSKEERPFILITNPSNGSDRPSSAIIQRTLLEGELLDNREVRLGFIVDRDYQHSELVDFLAGNPGYHKSIIFQFTPVPDEVAVISASIQASQEVEHLIFDEIKAKSSLRAALSWFPNKVLIVDGFQRPERNADFPANSSFESPFSSWYADGYTGFGDYVIVGQKYSEGGMVYVVALHVTAPPTRNGIIIHHFKSTILSDKKGVAAPKFKEANELLTSSPVIRALPSTSGLAKFNDWQLQDHFPTLGGAKQASIQHHIEVMAELVP